MRRTRIQRRPVLMVHDVVGNVLLGVRRLHRSQQLLLRLSKGSARHRLSGGTMFLPDRRCFLGF